MSNYTKATNFTLKDGLVTGDVNKIIKGSEIDAEYVSISAAISSKADLNGPTFTGTPNAPTVAVASTSSTQIATTAFVQSAVVAGIIGAYPVGSIYMNATVATNPNTLLGFGTWTAFGAGRILLGDGGGFTSGNTGGSADAIVPSHNHASGTLATDSQGAHQHTTGTGRSASTAGGTVGYYSGLHAGAAGTALSTTNSAGAHVHSVSGDTATTGVSVTDANLQPYIVVYMWKRTS